MLIKINLKFWHLQYQSFVAIYRTIHHLFLNLTIMSVKTSVYCLWVDTNKIRKLLRFSKCQIQMWNISSVLLSYTHESWPYLEIVMSENDNSSLIWLENLYCLYFISIWGYEGSPGSNIGVRCITIFSHKEYYFRFWYGQIICNWIKTLYSS